MPRDGGGDRAVVIVVGADRVGIVAGVADVLAESGVNIVDLASTKMGDVFTMVLLADLEGSKVDVAGLRRSLEAKADELGVKVMVHHYDVFKAMHRV